MVRNRIYGCTHKLNIHSFNKWFQWLTRNIKVRWVHSTTYSRTPIWLCICSRVCSIKSFKSTRHAALPRLFEIVRRLEGVDIILYYVHNIMTRIIITLALKYSVAPPIRRAAGSLSSSMSRLCRLRDAVVRAGGMRSYITHCRRRPSRFQLIKLGGANCRLPVHLYMYIISVLLSIPTLLQWNFVSGWPIPSNGNVQTDRVHTIMHHTPYSYIVKLLIE